MKIIRAIAFFMGMPFCLIGLTLVAFACGIRIESSDSLSDVCRKLS